MRHPTSRFLTFALGLTSVAAFALACSDSKAPVPAHKLVKPAVEKAEAPPAPVEEMDDSALSSKASELEALQASLLGLNKAAPAEEAPPPPVRKKRRRKVVDDYDYGDENLDPVDENGLSDSAFYSVVGSWSGMKRCLATTTVRGERTGALKIKFEISKDGSVTDSDVEDPSNDAARQISDCVSKQARKIRFPAFAGMDSVSKQAKFVF